jgi:hypothetical protein
MRPVCAAMLLVLAGHAALAEDARLKPGPGDETTAATCTACHTTDYIVMNSSFLPPDGWKAEVAKMRAAYGAPIDDTTAAEITDYLAKNYAAVAPKP